MRGGWTPYRSTGAAAIKKYFYGPEAEFDNYYFQGTEPGCAERIIHRAGAGAETVAMDAEDYEAWVDFTDPETGESRGTVRKNSLRFLEKNINVDKTLSLAALDSPEVASQLREAMREAATATATYGGEHFTTRVTENGITRQVPVEQVEVAVIAHKTSRENEPHPHLHVQFSGRVYAAGKWRQLDTADAWKHSAALNAHIEQTIHTHPGLRKALAAHGFNFDPATGKVAELEPYAEAFSTRHQQIEHNKELLEANWRADPANAGKTPGPAVYSAWDYMAWAGTAELEHIDAELIPRPEKSAENPGSLEDRWRAQLADAGYRSPTTPAPEPGQPWPHREELAEQTITALASRSSAWSTADIRAEAARQITAAGVIADRETMTRYVEMLVSTTEQHCRSMADPRITAPETARHWTAQSIIDTEDELKTRLAARAAAKPPALTAEQVREVFPMLNQEQAEAVAALAAGTRLTVIEGYAGSGKTAVLGAAAQVRGDRSLLTVTPTLKAAQEARSAGAQACSLHKLLHVNGYRWDENNQWTRLAPGETDPATGQVFQPPTPGSDYHLAPDTQIVVDEAGMLDQEAARALLTLADEHQADLALMGDRAQLSAVGRGGVMDMAARITTDHVELDKVHRFGADTDYAEISQKLRNREDLPETFDRLHQRGNLRIHATEEDAQRALATDAAADIQAGRSIALTVPTNAKAAELNRSIQAERIFTRQIKMHENPATGSDGLEIYAGDTVMTRSNNKELGVANRESFRVVNVHEDGALTVAGEDDRHQLITAEYVREHVHLGYAVTDYGNQGTTVDHGSTLLEEGMSGGGAYVAATRGRQDNTLHIVAENTAEAREKFTHIMSADRADRGLDQARRDLAEELRRIQPEPAPKPLDERVQSYLDKLHTERSKWEQRAEQLKPLHEYQQRAKQFAATHTDTPQNLSWPLHEAQTKAQQAQQVAENTVADIQSAAHKTAHKNIGTLQAKERMAADKELPGKTRRQWRAEAEDFHDKVVEMYGEEPPGATKQRAKKPDPAADQEWANRVAKQEAQRLIAQAPEIPQAQQTQARVEELRARKESADKLWNTEVGPRPATPKITDPQTKKQLTYIAALDRIEKIDQVVSYVSDPANEQTVITELEKREQQKQQPHPEGMTKEQRATMERARASQAKPASDAAKPPKYNPYLDPTSPEYQATRGPSAPHQTGPDLGR